MDLDFDRDQDELRDTIRAVLTKESPIALARRVVETGERPDALWQTMTELGWPALTVPEADGGIGLGMIEAAILAEELGRVMAPGALLPTVTQYVPVVRACASPDQRAALLAPVAEGRVRATLAVAEATGSFDLDATEAAVTRDASGITLHGTKRYVLEATEADGIACTVRLDGNVVVAVVPRDAVDVRPIEAIDASRVLADVVLDGARIDAGRLLRGGPALHDALEEVIVALALEIVGTCQTIFDITLEYAKQRHQFGVPIGSFQAMKHKFADMIVALERARSTGYYAALCIAEDDERRHVAAAAAKAAAGDAQRLFAKEGIQILGGIGYTWEHDMQLLVKRLKTDEALFGGAPQSRARIADLLSL